MRARRLGVVFGAFVAFLTASPASHADGPPAGANAPQEVSIPGAGGLQALTVKVDLAHRVIHFTVGKTPGEASIDLPPSEGAPNARVTVESVSVGEGKQVAHVRVVPTESGSGGRDVAWEAVLAGREPAVLWAGVTGYARGESGELAGEALDLPGRDGGEGRVVVVGEVREDLRICDQTRTILSPRVLDPQTMTFRGATMQRLPGVQREGAEQVFASAHGGPAASPLARLLLATGASSAVGAPAAVTDGNPSSTWAEGRPSDGHGEFVMMRAPADVPITRLAITVAPPSPAGAGSSGLVPHGAAPRSFFLVSDHRTIEVTLPEDAWMHPGASYDIPLVDPLRASCVTLVLDKAYERPGEAHPEVTVAELTGYSAFDAPNATLSDVAKALGGGGPRGESAKAVLERAGDPGLAAAAAAYGSLDAAGRALAIDAAIGAGTCEGSASLLLAATGDADKEVARKGREKLERCGKRAAPALLAALRGSDEAARASAAALASEVAPREALEPLVGALGQGAATTRAAVRSGVARAARVASKETLAALVKGDRGPDARLDLLRALEAKLPSLPVEADGAIEALASGSPSMRVRYLLVGPVASLARSGDAAATTRLSSLIAGDADPAVRAHAAESAAGIDGAKPALIHAADADTSPRAREASLEALAGTKPPFPVSVLTTRLATDDWTFVRAAAAAALASLPAERHVDDALTSALGDASSGVREAVITALAAHGATGAAKAIRAHLEEARETLEVRLAAAKAVAALCDRGSIDLLTKLAARLPLPEATDEDILVGSAAAEGLGRLHPADLAARLAPLTAKDARAESRAAASRALATPGGCR